MDARCPTRLHRPTRGAVFGLGFGLVAILVHSSSDFGQRIPAVFCMTMASCGLIVNLARSAGPEEKSVHPAPTPGVRYSEHPIERSDRECSSRGSAPRSLSWFSPGADRLHPRAAAQYHWDKAGAIESDLSAQHWQGSDAAFAQLLTEASAASAWEPRDVQYRYWLNVYRWRSVARIDPAVGHVLVDDQARDIRSTDHRRAARDRALCPTFGLPLSTAGQIELFFLGDTAAGERHIEQGYELARANPQCCLIAGALDARRGPLGRVPRKASPARSDPGRFVRRSAQRLPAPVRSARPGDGAGGR
jgi:hypothetical protein